ncbi:MAG: FAD-dependent monooxygenase [Rivularia sp. (in: cyanobacteria)]
MKTDVIIIGAGPTGLSLACQLIRYGIDFIIIEKNEGVTAYSKAVGVQARTLEIYEQLDLGYKAVECGQIASKIGIIEGGKICGEVDLSNMGQGLSPYPYLLILEQSKNEQLLYEYLQNHQKEVLWKTELEHFSQNEAGVTVHIKTANGDSQFIKANYLVGCTFSNQPDNKSMVREKIAQEYNHLVDYHALPLNPRVAEVFGVNESFSLLLRPDNYIGFISRNTSLDKLEDYFAFFS